jgi:hypothetical protein
MHKVTLIREPLLHFISHVEHDMRRNVEGLHAKIQNWDNEKPVGLPIANPQYSRVVGRAQNLTVSPDLITEHLNSHFSFIGLTEFFDITLCSLYFFIHRKMTNRCCHGDFKAHQRNPRHKIAREHLLQTDDIRWMQKHRELDQILYTAAQRIFWTQVDIVSSQSACIGVSRVIQETSLQSRYANYTAWEMIRY